jgi:subtilase family serine protease
VIIAVIGLDDRSLGGPAGIGTGDPPGAHYMTPAAIAQLYNFPSFSAAGQTVGIFEPANDGAAYLASDIQEYITSLGITTPLHIKDIGVKVGGVVQVNNPALVAISPPIGGVLEATLDVSVVAAIAPACQINVYFSRNTEAGWDAFLHRAMHPHAGEHPPSVLSASWVWQFSDGAGSIGSLSAPASAASVINRHFREAAMRGITVFIAIGDWGSGNQVHDGHCHISYPNGDPWVTACGGTIIGDISSTTPPVFEEFTWSDANRPSLFDNYPYNATGGGVSAQFDRPLYQVLSGVLPISKHDGRVRRGVPDVAGMVGMESFFINAVGGYQLFGTSAVAPFYSALIAMINAFLHHNVGFLNPTLYRYGPEICRDITFGNNDSGYTPDAPYYVSGIGWDPCTGWGSLRGLRLLAALTPAPIIATAIASGGRFGNCCVGSFADEILTINNSGFAPLLISSIVSSSPDFLVPSVSSYPLEVGPGESMDVVIRYMPTGVGATTAKITHLQRRRL